MSDRVGLGFIGCGGVIRGHLDQGLKDFDDVEFVGWCSKSGKTAEARREQVGGRGEVYTDPRAMLDEAKPDAVVVALPPFAHGEVEDLLVERSLPFLIEKPVAIDIETALRVQEGVAKKNLITSVAYMTRYRESSRKVRELLQEKTPVLLHGGWLGPGPSKYEGIWEWWVRKDMSGGQFLEQTTHTIDLSRFLFGDVRSVYAVAVRDRRERPDFFTIEDASMVQLAFENGAAGNLYSSCCTAMDGGVRLHVWATDMKAVFTGWEQSVRIQLPDQEEMSIPGEENIFAVEDRAFIDAVRTGRTNGILATYEDGLKATAVACAANESMETGAVVTPRA
jgi:myo-inositol 2-dehydrogenase/D-chiro-inositol 1-dehydrogenase